MRRETGFSLIELVVVVAVIAILAAIAVPILLSHRQQGWQAQLTADVRSAMLDVEAAYVTNNGEYPDDEQFATLPIRLSGPQVDLVYSTNSDRSEFCLEGTHSQLPDGADVAHYRSGTGFEAFADCPAWDRP